MLCTLDTKNMMQLRASNICHGWRNIKPRTSRCCFFMYAIPNDLVNIGLVRTPWTLRGRSGNCTFCDDCWGSSTISKSWSPIDSSTQQWPCLVCFCTDAILNTTESGEVCITRTNKQPQLNADYHISMNTNGISMDPDVTFTKSTTIHNHTANAHFAFSR